jgi:hypothetical protein
VFQARQLLVATIALAGSGCIVANPSPAPDPLSVQVRVTLCADNPACTTPARVHTGTLIYLEADTLLMYAEDRLGRLPIAVAHIAKLEVGRGRKPSAEGAMKGAGIGALLGTLAGAAAGVAGVAAFGGFAGIDAGEIVARSAVEGAVGGAVTGAAIGAGVGTPVWREVGVKQLREELCHCRIPELVAEL